MHLTFFIFNKPKNRFYRKCSRVVHFLYACDTTVIPPQYFC
jgi:hypothetical protein